MSVQVENLEKNMVKLTIEVAEDKENHSSLQQKLQRDQKLNLANIMV